MPYYFGKGRLGFDTDRVGQYYGSSKRGDGDKIYDGGGGGEGVKKILACSGGICKEVETATPEAKAACKGKAPGDPCSGQQFEETYEKPEGAGPSKGDWPGCPYGSRFDVKSENDKCPPGYKMVIGAGGPSCRCLKWCYDNGLGESCLGGGAGVGGGLGEFQWPQELLDLYTSLIGRSRELLGRKPGFSDEILNLMFGRDFEKIRGMERATRESVLSNLASHGLLGTGAGLEALNRTAWGTEGNIANIRRDLAIAQAQKELSDLLEQTEAARTLFGTGVGMQQALEAINAARRSEGRDALALLMSWLSSLLSSWAA